MKRRASSVRPEVDPRKRRPPERRPSPSRLGRPRRFPVPSPAEQRLLALAAELAAIAAANEPPRIRRDQALGRLAEAFGRDGESASLILAAWHRGRADRGLALAVAWAREQLRVSLQEILEAGARQGVMRRDRDPAALASVLLAGAESLLRDAPEGGTVPMADLLRVLAQITE
jgi:hypothetical protein